VHYREKWVSDRVLAWFGGKERKRMEKRWPSCRARRVDPDPEPTGSGSKISILSGPGPGPGPEIFLLPGPGPDPGPKISDMMNFS
jgi:hypothetical protein